MNAVGYDVMALGNHEFDRGVSGLIPLLDNCNFTIVSSNIDQSSDPTIQNKFRKHVIKEIGGERIGIIGYTTKDTPMISNSGNLVFLDEITSIKKEVTYLKNQGINKIIAVGHAGYIVDKRIATEIPDIDVIVGGHSNTFLYTGDAPSNEKPVNVYPTVVTHGNGNKGLVVQDYTFAKYLGVLHISFDDDGKITSYDGNPILLDNTVSKDEAIQNMTYQYGSEIEAIRTNVIGRTLVYLDGDRYSCRRRECNLGNVVADGMVHQNLLHADSIDGAKVFISLVNSGAVRASIERGNITIGHAMEVQPFRNTIETIRLRGDYLLQAMEHSVRNYNPEDPSGRFLQYSGIKVKYDMSKPPLKRVVEALAICQNCSVPVYEPVDKDTMYRIILSNFILGGGDSYTMIRDHAEQSVTVGDLDSDVFIEYTKNQSPFYQSEEGRITFVTEQNQDTCINFGVPIVELNTSLISLVICLFILL